MREKLIELLGADTCKKDCEDCKYCANREACIEYLKMSMADHLIANGVTTEVYDCHWATETAYKNGYQQGMKDAVKWISVNDRLPEEKGWYLVYTTPNREHKSINKAMFCKVYACGNFEPYWRGAGGHWANVTHWMPLPQPPKGE